MARGERGGGTRSVTLEFSRQEDPRLGFPEGYFDFPKMEADSKNQGRAWADQQKLGSAGLPEAGFFGCVVSSLLELQVSGPHWSTR